VRTCFKLHRGVRRNIKERAASEGSLQAGEWGSC
jgi:hypothetical protein